MSLLIPGPKAPGKEIDIYLKPLVDELHDLWVNGLLTYDYASKTNFNMRAALMWTINDFPAYGNLSGWSTKGYMACPVCNKYTPCVGLGRKIAYIGHRCYLPLGHRWRRSRRFDGKFEDRLPPFDLTGEDILAQLSNLEDVPLGKHPLHSQTRRRSEELNWTKKSVFFLLPYWSSHLLRHNLDVMHIEKNICDNILGTMLGLDGKTKDTIKS